MSMVEKEYEEEQGKERIRKGKKEAKERKKRRKRASKENKSPDDKRGVNKVFITSSKKTFDGVQNKRTSLVLCSCHWVVRPRKGRGRC